MQTDTAIEQEIQAKGLTAPRVTPADIEANIAYETYFTASEGANQADGDPGPMHLDLLTFCVLVLRNGFTVTGESACASPENFDAELGQKIARANAVNKIWPLMGYALKEQLFQATQPAKPMMRDGTPADPEKFGVVAFAAAEPALPPHQQRVLDEKIELDVKLSKLLAFFGSETYKAIPGQDQHLLQQQAVSMEHYSEILGMRIEGFGITA